jgi:adenine-specific DNA-methyltransferase
MKRTEMATARYRNPDNDPRGPWKASDLSVSLTSGQRGQHFQRTGQSPNLYLVTAPSGRQVEPPANRCWSVSSERFAELNADNRIWWGKSGDNVPALKRFLSEVQQGIIPQTVWMHDEVGHNQEASKEIKALFDGQELFSTPKPERLLQRIIDIGSDPGDLVLDCFLGSGTTAAVAHKLGRRWIGIELNYTASRIYLERLKKVIDGHDQGGISKYIPPDPNQATSAVGMLDQVPTVSGWQGGGGFCFYRLGQALLERDAETGVWKLNYTNSRLVEAICLLEGFHILADGPRHGVRGRHYAHITDHFVTQSLVDQLGAFLDDGETLTIYAAKAATLLHLPDTIDVKRIPHALIEERTL